jgi:hypothetical protein
MFTGIVTDLGTVRSLRQGAVTRLEIATTYDTGDIALGASVACNGCCLSVVEKGPDWLAFEAAQETLNVTTLKDWQVGSRINLERPTKVGDELGGHIVAGHVDGVGTVVIAAEDRGSLRLTIKPLKIWQNISRQKARSRSTASRSRSMKWPAGGLASASSRSPARPPIWGRPQSASGSIWRSTSSRAMSRDCSARMITKGDGN